MIVRCQHIVADSARCRRAGLAPGDASSRTDSDVVPHPRVGELKLLGHLGDGSRLAPDGVHERVHLHGRELLSLRLDGLLG